MKQIGKTSLWSAIDERLEPGKSALEQLPHQHLIEGGADETIEFGVAPDDRERELSFDIPHLDDMDELFVVRAAIAVSAEAVDQQPLAVSSASGKAKLLQLPGGDPRVGGLSRVQIRGLVPEGAPDVGWRLVTSSLSIRWRKDHDPDTEWNSGVMPLRFLARIDHGAGFGPPIAAAPKFPMPGDPGGLYGPALAGASLVLSRTSGRIDATLTFSPPLESRRVELLLAVVPETTSLPNEAQPVSWRAESIDATWTTKLRGLEVDARIPSVDPPAPAPVASYPGVAASSVREIDFSAAARSLLRTAYAERGESTIALRLVSGSIGRLQLHARKVEAEYRRLLVGEDGVAVGLRGGVERLELAIPAGLRPSRFTLTFDGRFGSAALVAASDWGELDPKRPGSGYRVAGSVALARYVPLTIAEAGRRLVRVGVEGFGQDTCELLLALHRGDPRCIGSRYGDPVALDVPDGSTPTWHRAELTGVAGQPPHPGGVWVVATVSRGAFWWAGSFDDDETQADPTPLIQRSPDAGASWDVRSGRLRTQVHQEWLDDAGQPIPVPIPCTWVGGQLRSDIRPETQLGDPAFRGVGLSLLGSRELTSNKAGPTLHPIDSVAFLGDTLALGFDARRDVDFRILDAVMTYNPWLAKD